MPFFTACSISSTTVVVFPVPGGPWITATSGLDRAESTALRWLEFKLGVCHGN